MGKIILKARAKINLSLDVLKKRQDGYHEVRMIMQTLALHDQVTIEEKKSIITIECDNAKIPSGEENIAFKAARLVLNKFGINSGVAIKINKKIPVSAGLAGGSSNASAVIKGLNKLFDINMSEKEMMDLGKQIGADVPYCIKGGTALAEGIGEIIKELKQLPYIPVLLIKPNISISTIWAYQNIDVDKILKRPDTKQLVKAINDRNINYLAKNMKNVFEEVATKKYEIINEIKHKLMLNGAVGSMMSGSGPSVFGIFKDDGKQKVAFENMKDGRWKMFATHTC